MRHRCVRLIAGVAGLFALGVATTTPAGATTSDTYRSRQWNLDRISAEPAWLRSTGTGAVVAVVDTGADLTHPDLAANLIVNNDADMVEPKGTCTTVKRRTTCVQDGPADKNGHGTHVAGTIAAVTNNGLGVAGVAPGAKVLPVRVLDADGSGTTDQVAAGIRYAANHGADVINLSLGFLSGADRVVKLIGELAPVYSALDYAWSKNVVIVIAAGNDTAPLCAEPSAYPHAICVGATDPNDLPSFYSNSEPTMTSQFLRAPGGAATLFCKDDVLSTVWRGATHSSCSPQNGYDAYAGTSMATPHVSAVAALIASLHPAWTNQQIVDQILHSADDLGTPGRDPVYGWGRLNANRAVAV